ncbi:MAG: hypothetical protein Q7R78_01210 [bacterium]|nr:hypothetical protein [bacterium]
MKKTQPINQMQIGLMALHFGLKQMSVKLALNGPNPSVEMESIISIKSLDDMDRLIRKAKSWRRKVAIARKGLSVCATLNDYESWERILWDDRFLEYFPQLKYEYFTAMCLVVKNAITKAETFEEVFTLWERLRADHFFSEDILAYEKMKNLIPVTSTRSIFSTLLSERRLEMLQEDSPHYNLLIFACEYATPNQAYEALKWFWDFTWQGEENSEPVRILIRKASELFPRKKKQTF